VVAGVGQDGILRGVGNPAVRVSTKSEADCLSLTDSCDVGCPMRDRFIGPPALLQNSKNFSFSRT